MKDWLKGKRGGLAAFAVIAALVAGGLGWVTDAALQMEDERAAARAETERAGVLRLAMWRLDSLLFPDIAKEAGRPFNNYGAVYAPALVLRSDGNPWQAGSVLQPSPLLSAELPDWMLLHFQTDLQSSWTSPQVLSQTLYTCLVTSNKAGGEDLCNVTPDRQVVLTAISGKESAQVLAARLHKREVRDSGQSVTSPSGGRANDRELALLPPDRNKQQQWQNDPPQEQNRNPAQGQQGGLNNNDLQVANAQDFGTRSRVYNQNSRAGKTVYYDDDIVDNSFGNGEKWLSGNPNKKGGSERVSVSLGPMTPLWLKTAGQPERLLLARRVKLGTREIAQGVVLDFARLQKLLGDEVRDLFPEASFRPVHDDAPIAPERTLTALPIELDPGPAPAPGVAGWTPLRVGLAFSWVAALVALSAVGLGGWSLIDLSERRIRFVSAVTHELRTPLTTLRLYLDMLTGGLVKEEAKKTEYLNTLHAETDRLNRLVANVLDFARLENHRPRLNITCTPVAAALEQVREAWTGRCGSTEKELVIENSLDGATLSTDVDFLRQILGNLIDNACKYSQGAADKRIRLRAGRDVRGRLVLQVADHGPGVPARERAAIFRPFRRGQDADVTAGGVGLGLALAQRWAGLLGGKLTLCPSSAGACFQLELPASCLETPAKSA